MKRKEIVIDSSITDIEELQQIVESLCHLIDDAETRVNDIVDLLDIKDINEIVNLETAYDQAKELADDLY